MEHFPIVAKSEMNDLYQTIHDLKKTIKTLEQKINATTVNGAVVNTATTTATATNKTTTAKKSTTV
jgi:cell division septum initiation protein DivIVA